MGKTLAMVLGYVFVILGVLGFISNPLVGSTGYFLADTVHNLIHLVSGIVFLWVAYGAPMKSGAVLKIFGVVYLLIAILGFFQAGDVLLGFISSNMHDTWLHLVLGVVLLVGGLKAKGMPQGM
ncbi:MAG: TonB-dependent siderophore receptor [Parcubacteria group bacterium]|nr:TonB-dependent siderophore receptor [Parcubacteria group bacterium]